MESATTNGHKVVVNLSTGHEDADRVTVAFLVGTAALAAGKQVTMFLTKEAVRLRCRDTPTPSRGRGRPRFAVVPAVRRQRRPALHLPSASTPATSTTKRSSIMRGSPGPPRCGNGSATAQPSSATEH